MMNGPTVIRSGCADIEDTPPESVFDPFGRICHVKSAWRVELFWYIDKIECWEIPNT